eukprot:COSAG06_NODE_12214_length_1409_cov_2.045802_3_plen_47_part_01
MNYINCIASIASSDSKWLYWYIYTWKFRLRMLYNEFVLILTSMAEQV